MFVLSFWEEEKILTDFVVVVVVLLARQRIRVYLSVLALILYVFTKISVRFIYYFRSLTTAERIHSAIIIIIIIITTVIIFRCWK